MGELEAVTLPKWVAATQPHYRPSMARVLGFEAKQEIQIIK